MKFPVEYKKGYTDFLGCHIDLRYRPLIPRIETEYWVKEAIKIITKIAKSMHMHQVGNFVKFSETAKTVKKIRVVRVLDLFAGSGCVGIAVLKNVVGSHIDFVDLSPRCLRQIEINCQLNNIERERYRLIMADVFSFCHSEPQAKNLDPSRGVQDDVYDVILANPPYCVRKNVDPAVLSFEPKQAVLGGGKDGLRLIKRFLRQAHRYLKPGGRIYMEFDHFQKPLLEKLLQQSNYRKWEFKKDQFGRYRLLTINH